MNEFPEFGLVTDPEPLRQFLKQSSCRHSEYSEVSELQLLPLAHKYKSLDIPWKKQRVERV